MRNIGIIGGSGVYSPEILEKAGFKNELVHTPYGDVPCLHGEKFGNKVTFITRHGAQHSTPPHLINYRANIAALKKMRVEEIIATAAVGSINKDMQSGHFVICDQILDFTKSRINTFFNGTDFPVGHADFSHPYCPTLRNILIDCLEDMGANYHKTGTMVVTEGPRFETPAEIKMYAQFGGDVVNMTGMPEAILAREAEMHYAVIAMVTNMAAGISTISLSHAEVLESMKKSEIALNKLIDKFIAYDKKVDKQCFCDTAMKDFGGFKI